jgi:NAD(P)-dependent dehydrogenase (short-subunit alcohol dehydrogenase family)
MDLAIETLFGVRGKTVVVTGGASGIGLAIARGYVENGAQVIVLDIDQKALDVAASTLGEGAETLVTDISDKAAVDLVFDAIDARHAGIDVVFANAGIGGGPGFAVPGGERIPEGSLDGMPMADWDRMLAVNLTGVRNTIAAAARIMKARGAGGRIITTSSAAAVVNVPFVSTAYHAAKAAVAHLTRHAALELAPFNILVNAIAPANFITNIGGGEMKNDDVRAVFARASALGRTADPEEIAGLALFLGSSASSYVTGVHLLIDGGAALKSAS